MIYFPFHYFDMLLGTRGVWELDVPLVVCPLRWFFCLLRGGSFHFVPCFPPLFGCFGLFWIGRVHLLFWFKSWLVGKQSLPNFCYDYLSWLSHSLINCQTKCVAFGSFDLLLSKSMFNWQTEVFIVCLFLLLLCVCILLGWFGNSADRPKK